MNAITDGPRPAGAGAVLVPALGRTDWERWNRLVIAFPQTADRLLTAARIPDPVMLAVLKAQARMRLDRPREAQSLAAIAVSEAGAEQPLNRDRLLGPMTVLTDAAVLAGAPDAVGACENLLAATRQFQDQPRRIIAAGLHAVATYHQHGCIAARDLLALIRPTAAPAAGAIAAARETLDTCCARRRWAHRPPDVLPELTAGGWIPKMLTHQFLADRLLRWPGIHDCTTPTIEGEQR